MCLGNFLCIITLYIANKLLCHRLKGGYIIDSYIRSHITIVIMVKGGELTISEKSTIRSLREQKKSRKNIATFIQKSKSAVIRTYQKSIRTGSLQSRPTAGRPKLLPPRTILNICLDVNVSPFIGVNDIKQYINVATGINVRNRKIRRILAQNDLCNFKASRKPLLTKMMMKERML